MTGKDDSKVVGGGDIEFSESSAKADEAASELPQPHQQKGAVQTSVVYDDLSGIIEQYADQIGHFFFVPKHVRAFFAFSYHVVPGNFNWPLWTRSYTLRPYARMEKNDATTVLEQTCKGLNDQDYKAFEAEYCDGLKGGSVNHVNYDIFPEYRATEQSLRVGGRGRYEEFKDYPNYPSFDFLRIPPAARKFFLGVLKHKGSLDCFRSMDPNVKRPFANYLSKLHKEINLTDIIAYAKKIKLPEPDAVSYTKMLSRYLL